MIIFDIDDTLSIIGDRQKYLKQEPKDWDSFFMACDQDEPNWPIVNLCRVLQSTGVNVMFVTGRAEVSRTKTLTWLKFYDLLQPNTMLLMRPVGDFRHDVDLKPDLVKDVLGAITMVFEDRNSMVKKWREMGITCCQVRETEY